MLSELYAKLKTWHLLISSSKLVLNATSISNRGFELHKRIYALGNNFFDGFEFSVYNNDNEIYHTTSDNSEVEIDGKFLQSASLQPVIYNEQDFLNKIDISKPIVIELSRVSNIAYAIEFKECGAIVDLKVGDDITLNNFTFNGRYYPALYFNNSFNSIFNDIEFNEFQYDLNVSAKNLNDIQIDSIYAADSINLLKCPNLQKINIAELFDLKQFVLPPAKNSDCKMYIWTDDFTRVNNSITSTNGWELIEVTD